MISDKIKKTALVLEHQSGENRTSLPGRDKIEAAVPFQVTPHMLRHTYCTSLALAGIHLKRAQYLMGHSSIQMTANIYSHIEAQDVADTKEAVEAYFLKSSQKVVKNILKNLLTMLLYRSII